MKKVIRKKLSLLLVSLLFLMSSFLSGCYSSYELTTATTETVTDSEYDSYDEEYTDFEHEDAESTYEETEEQLTEYLTFRYDDYLQEHYEKHGVDMGFASPEDYLDAANAVVYNPSSLHKIEAEDGDDVYYLEITNEFVVVSTDGYIRTYFCPNDGIDYFNRQ